MMDSLPIAFEPTPQKTGYDCAVSCLKMLLEVEYLEAANAFSKRGKVVRKGASDRQILLAAKNLGHKLRFVKDADLSETVGILQVESTLDEFNHVVMLVKGSVYDPGANLFWAEVGDFLHAGTYTIDGVFVREES
jgi:hypothetical protein